MEGHILEAPAHGGTDGGWKHAKMEIWKHGLKRDEETLGSLKYAYKRTLEANLIKIEMEQIIIEARKQWNV